MATLQQLKSVFAPVLAQHSDLILHRRWLFKPLIRHAIVGIYVDERSNPAAPQFQLSIVPLSRADRPASLGYNRPMLVERVIGGAAPQHRLPATVPSRFLLDVFAPEFSAHLIENFNAKARPFIDRYQSWQGLLDWVGDPQWKQWLGPSPEPTEGWGAIMAGDFAGAASILLTYVERMEALLTKDFRFPAQPMPPHLLLCRALADILTTQDPVRIAAHMHAMEAATIAHHKLQKFWQPTPFPFE